MAVCEMVWYDGSFSFISPSYRCMYMCVCVFIGIAMNPTRYYIDTKRMLDRLDNFKCKICPFKYMLRDMLYYDTYIMYLHLSRVIVSMMGVWGVCLFYHVICVYLSIHGKIYCARFMLLCIYIWDFISHVCV